MPVRKVRINYGTYDLAMWLDSIKDKRPEAYVWVGQGRKNMDRHLSIDSLAGIVKKAVRLSGMPKKTWLHLFRHSRATELATKLSDQGMRIYFGWSSTSDMPSHYSHLTDTKVDEMVLEGVYGITRASRKEHEIVTCPQCKYRNINAENSEFCHGCGFPFKSEAAIKLLQRRKLAEEIANEATLDSDWEKLMERVARRMVAAKAIP